MKIESVYSPEFAPYGAVLSGYDLTELMSAMKSIALPSEGTAYQPAILELERLPIANDLFERAFGGMPVQVGMCWGRNTKLNCLEYHRNSEFNLGTDDFVLLVARREDIKSGLLDTSKVRAFRVPAGVLVEVYATTLHYAPCHTDVDEGFRVAVVLPRGTNEAKPAIKTATDEDQLLWARNKWLLAHADSTEAQNGAPIRISGPNIDIANDI